MRLIDADAIEYESIDSCDTERYERYYGTGIIAVRKEDIDEMPTAHPESHWIPCSERLPNRDELVLVTYKITGRIHLCKYLDDGSENSWWSYINYGCAWNNMVLAWMPLPEPFKEVTE